MLAGETRERTRNAGRYGGRGGLLKEQSRVIICIKEEIGNTRGTHWKRRKELSGLTGKNK